jgi:hypothetical protein
VISYHKRFPTHLLHKFGRKKLVQDPLLFYEKFFDTRGLGLVGGNTKFVDERISIGSISIST